MARERTKGSGREREAMSEPMYTTSPRIVCPNCKRSDSFYQHGIGLYRCTSCSEVFTRMEKPEPEEWRAKGKK